MKKILQFSCFVLISLSSAAHYNGKLHNKHDIITTPFQPRPAIKHETKIKLLSSGVFAGTVFLGAKYFLGKDSAQLAGLSGLLAFLAGYSYSPFNAKLSSTEELIMRPEEALQQAEALNQSYRIDIENILKNDTIDTSKALTLLKNGFEQRETQCPYFMLGECTLNVSAPCLLSHLQNPYYRRRFEGAVIGTLLQKWDLQEVPVQYVSFGSGGMFQDLVIVSRALAQKPDAALTIHLIDEQYHPVETGRKYLGVDRQIMAHQIPDLQPVVQELKNKEAQDDVSEKRIQCITLALELACQQFIKYLQKTYPQAKLALHVHRSVNSYFSYIEQHAIPTPDIVVAADIQDGMSNALGAADDYRELCFKAEMTKPDCYNVLLGLNTREYPMLMQRFTRDGKHGVRIHFIE